MTQKEIKLINAINCDGLDNSMWGISGFQMTLQSLYGDVAVVVLGTEKNKDIPAHIYVYRECNECSLRNEIIPDLTLEDEYGQIIDLYYIEEEGGKQ